MKVALFGAGTMGRGIAQVFAAKGHTVLMYASSPASAQRHIAASPGAALPRADAPHRGNLAKNDFTSGCDGQR